MIKKAIAAVVALYVIVVGAMFGRLLSMQRATEENQRRAIELGELHARTPTTEDQPIADACKGKLAQGYENSLAVYVAKMKWAPSLRDDFAHVDRMLVGTDKPWNHILAAFYEDLTVTPRPVGVLFKENLNPVDLARHLRWPSGLGPDLKDVRYLVVARYASLTLPTTEGDGYSAGSGEYGAKVLSFPTGEIICEGKGHVRMKERVSASGRDEDTAKTNAGNLVQFVFTKAVVISPLEELCSVGGPTLCDMTSQWVGH